MINFSIFTRRSLAPYAVLLLGVSIFVVGCAATKQTSPFESGTPASETKRRTARSEVNEVRRLMNMGDEKTVIPRLQQTIAQFPTADASVEARYLLGIAYYRIQAYRDATLAFKEYLRLAPDGEYASKCTEYIAKIDKEYREKYVTADELDAKIQKLKDKLDKDPGNVDYQWELADKLWQRGNYDEAAELYVSVVTKRPSYAEKAVFKKRVELLPDGHYVTLTPAEIERRRSEEQPLAVINEYAFRAGRDWMNRFTTRYYVVTGQVVNRSDSVLYGAQVNVTLYGFGNVVYDTRTVGIGRLNPGEIRAFSVRFSDFEDIHSIYKHECVATFQR